MGRHYIEYFYVNIYRLTYLFMHYATPVLYTYYLKTTF